MNKFYIDNFVIGDPKTPFIIAESGINHNGILENAFKMIETAKKSGASAIKFQTFTSEEFIADPSQMYTYQSQGKQITESMLSMFQRYEFSKDEWFQIKKKCDNEKILFLSTPLNKKDLKLLLELGISAIKLGSGDFNNIPFLKTCISTELPLIVSCGMSDLNEIKSSLETIGTFQGYSTVLLLTTSEYPTPPQNANILKLKLLSNEFPDLPLGYSDHTQGPLASSLALAFGASVFEKHFTLNHNLPGPDHWFSEDPDGLVNWINSIKQTSILLGTPELLPTTKELENKKEFQKVIVAETEIHEGELFTDSNLSMKRIPGGHGLLPKFFESLIGKKAKKNYSKDSPIEQ